MVYVPEIRKTALFLIVSSVWVAKFITTVKPAWPLAGSLHPLKVQLNIVWSCSCREPLCTCHPATCPRILFLPLMRTFQHMLGNGGGDAPLWKDSSEWFFFCACKEGEGGMFPPSSPVSSAELTSSKTVRVPWRVSKEHSKVKKIIFELRCQFYCHSDK